MPEINKEGSKFSIDVSDAVVVNPKKGQNLENKAVTVLIEEVKLRTGITLDKGHRLPEGGKPAIVVISESSLHDHFKVDYKQLRKLKKPGPEGYRIFVKSHPTPIVFVVGSDCRGVLYGVGKLLRKLILEKQSIKVNPNFSISSTPHNALRGHQLGYRPKTNAYDAWTPGQFEQYIRELALFGTNSIEILPPRTDDKKTNSLMKIPPLEMMEQLSRIIDSYGLDVWIWYPNMGEDYTDPECIQNELEERKNIFNKLTRVDNIFIPGGDPGDIPVNTLFNWGERVSQLLREYHPKAKVWLSPQKIYPPEGWFEKFYENLNNCPSWLGGLVYGPWIKTTLPKFREKTPDQYSIRHYPDISHLHTCQYPVHDWDRAFAMTLGRECINPRPIAYKYIHNTFDEYVIGSLSYSEGINDDVNKFVWSDQDWNPSTSVMETLTDYARLFISPKHDFDIARGLIALEENFETSLLNNEKVQLTLHKWKELESKMPEEASKNYRFIMGLLRAYYDAYIQRRLLREKEVEQTLIGEIDFSLEKAPRAIIQKAKQTLLEKESEESSTALRDRCEELSDALFQLIGAQLSVKKHKAKHWKRGAFMDAIDIPLSNLPWIMQKLESAHSEKNDEKAKKILKEIIRRKIPGVGGVYENFKRRDQDSIHSKKSWSEDPGYLESPVITFATNLLHSDQDQSSSSDPVPVEWISNIMTHYDNEIELEYENLDSSSPYRIKVVYNGVTLGSRKFEVKLLGNDKFNIHDYIVVDERIVIKESIIPMGVIAEDGKLKLSFSTREGQHGPAISEIWLMKGN